MPERVLDRNRADWNREDALAKGVGYVIRGFRHLSGSKMAWRRGQAYGQDLRDRVLACPDMTLVQVAERFGVSPSYVSKVRARLRDLGEAAAGPQHNHVPLRLAPFTDALRTQIKRSPDATLNELRSWLMETQKVSVSYAVMWKVVARLGLTFKKSTSRPRNSSARI